MDKFVQQYKQSIVTNEKEVKETKESRELRESKEKKKAKINDEYDEVLRELDRLQDFAPIRWQLGGPTWAVVGNDILPDKKKPGIQ